MTFQKRSRSVKTNVEATFLKRFCAGWGKANKYSIFTWTTSVGAIN